MHVLFPEYLSTFNRKQFKKFRENKDALAHEMKRDVITDYLRNHEHLTVRQYQRVIAKKYDYEANKYLLELIISSPRKYLAGLKDALMNVNQEHLIDKLP